MGGAERNARQRKQQRTSVGKAAATSTGSGRVTIVAIAAVIVLAAVVVGGVLWSKSGSDDTSGHAIPVAKDAGKTKQPGSRDGVSVVRGSDDAGTSIDIYEDFMCPACGQFEDAFGDRIEKKIESGDLRVRYHMLPMLVQQSNPPGYSRDAANAALCAADEGEFVGFHDSLYASQPEEGQRGYDKDQLAGLGKNLGISDDGFASCVKKGKYDDKLDSEFKKISQDPDLQQESGGQKGFSTPTVTSDGDVVDIQSKDWLDKLLKKQEK